MADATRRPQLILIQWLALQCFTFAHKLSYKILVAFFLCYIMEFKAASMEFFLSYCSWSPMGFSILPGACAFRHRLGPQLQTASYFVKASLYEGQVFPKEDLLLDPQGLSMFPSKVETRLAAFQNQPTSSPIYYNVALGCSSSSY